MTWWRATIEKSVCRWSSKASLLGVIALISGNIASQAACAAEAGGSSVEGQKASAAFVACVVERSSSERVHKLLDLPFYSPETQKKMLPLLTHECLKTPGVGKMKLPAILLRGAFFEYFYRKEFSAEPYIAKFETSINVVYPFASDEDKNGLTNDYRFMMAVGECVVRKSPTDARALMLSEIASVEESRSVEAIARLIPACVPDHQSIRVNKSMLRAMVAEPLYRLSSLNEQVHAQG